MQLQCAPVSTGEAEKHSTNEATTKAISVFFFLRIGDLPFLPAEFCGKKGVRNYGGRE
jgi:peroxiredoxin